MDINISKEQLKKIAEFNQANPYVDIIPYEIGIGTPIVNYKSFFPQSGECILFVTPAHTFKDKNMVLNYTKYNRRPIRGNVRNHNYGDLIITSKRIVFIGKDDSFDYSINKLSAIKMLDNQSFLIQSGKSSKNIQVDPIIFVYAFGFISYVQQNIATGVDVYNKHQTSLTQEQLDYCNMVRKESFKILEQLDNQNKIQEENSKIKNQIDSYNKFQNRNSKSNVEMKSKNGCTGSLWLIVKIQFILIATIVILGLIVGLFLAINNNSNKNNQINEQISNYSAYELVTLENHPRIFDNYEDAQAFYNNIGDKRIAVTDIPKKASMERKLKKLYDDEIVIYITQNSTHEEYIGTVEINVYDPDFAANMNVEKATNLAISYLPKNFFDYYESDASYIWHNDNLKTYTRSYRLNNEGRKYRNSIAPYYSPYYYFKIYEYSNGEYWKIETGYAAFGDRDLGWIEKFAEPWDAPIK